jgi:hypothetical protein
MRRLFIVRALVAMGFGMWAASSGMAQDSPDSLVHFRVVPRLSIVHQTGGFPGVDWRWRLMGEYDLARGPNTVAQVAFKNAEIWGSLISKDAVPAIALDVDETFNLEGLNGRVLPTMGPFPVFEFRGTTEDDSKVHLLGAKIGPWMYLRGGVFPPDGGSDYFTYHMRAVARSRPFADLNDDGDVNATDYMLLRKFGNAAGLDGVTFADWRAQIGEKAPDLGMLDAMLNSAMGSLEPAANVPEPAAMGMILIGGVLLAGWRRR